MVRSTSRLAVLLLGSTLHVMTARAALPAEAPGSDLPPSGQSLFELVLDRNTDGTLQIPFPFTALLQRIALQLDAREPGGGLSVVLIPLGRSLQRHAAGDVEAFRYPRVVAAVTGEPPPHALPGHRYLKDRLYVAYHEKAAALEVISYNEIDARFEFQLVHDYRAAATPVIGHASRTLCLACHHNAAPIFSRQSWDETSASPPVAERLAATGLPYYGLQWRHGVDVPDAIDAATLRANLFATTQRLWREGCAGASRETAIACRAEALRQALRYRLGGSRPVALENQPDLHRLVQPLLATWQQRWPAGLEIPDPQIPNRQPFAALVGGERAPADAELPRFADIGAAFDPLALRPPLERWHGRNTADVSRFIHALSLFFSRTDIALIDRQLAAAPSPPVTEVDFSCTEREIAGQRLDLDCSAPDGGRLLARIGLQPQVMNGRMNVGMSSGTIDRLVMPGNDSMGTIEMERSQGHGNAHGADDARNIHFALQRDGSSVRTASGQAIRRLHLTRATATAPARALVQLAADLGPLDQAIEALERATLAGTSDALDDMPLRRGAVLGPLFDDLGIRHSTTPSAWVSPSPYPAPSTIRLADPITPRAAPWPPDLLAFVRQCSQCHAAATEFPPGFLHGDDAQVRSQITGCAERMLYRLEMNGLPPAARPKTPMPPPAAAHADSFIRSTDLPLMRTALEGMLAASGASRTALLVRPYATLAPCTTARH
ncbi:MAG: hypothetical protein Q7J47_08690 [Azoarcus sp.]|nr:hypothetical protein [Azoarcus sp.]